MDILSSKIVTTRKKHKCSTCGRDFESGSKMDTTAIADEGSVFTFRMCETCNTLTKEFDFIFEDFDKMINEMCVEAELKKGQTPEELLIELRNERDETKNESSGLVMLHGSRI